MAALSCSDVSTGFSRAVTAVVAVVLIAIPLVAVLGLPRESPLPDAPGDPAGGVEKQQVRPVTVDGPDLESFVENSTGSQVSFYRISDGKRTGTATERFARPALSLIKLYIAEYVIEHGTLTEQYEAINMISSSDDRSAGELYRKYPDSIDVVAKKYGLLSTRAADRWGFSVTSTYDAVNFIAQLLERDPMHPILVAMAEATPIAADGYGQDFGTSVLPGVIGTKWGWSDKKDLHSSVSFGENFVVAAAVTGSADDLTDLVEFQLTDEVEEAGRATGSKPSAAG
ncbi:MAG: hypothetical protein GX859_07325 [Corynebacterium humireducens]|jgi:hypothetical protein|uniref:Uncharacterized protein n=1 Tax=Corynebacterium humireducens TaxID=1223514 RepID=A0A7X6PNB6_9CORY|nr:hypothetical protein [Corynebacterium humireducens]